MLPVLDIDNAIQNISNSVNSSDAKLGRVFLFDFEKNKHVIQDGKLVECTEEQAIQQWIKLLIKTVLDKYKVYKDTGFGTTFDRIVGQKKLPQGFIESEIKREIEERIILHKKINGISNFTSLRTRNGLDITFIVNLKDGNTMQSEVSI